jgi:hypothetical protein
LLTYLLERLMASPMALEFGMGEAVTEFRRVSVAARERRRTRTRMRNEILGTGVVAILLVATLCG